MGISMIIGNKTFHVEENAYIMGILNVTPDSFSDGGSYTATDRAMERVEQMIRDGADIIDVGGESTRPGAPPVSAQEEMERVLPVVEKIKQYFNIPISLDTYKSSVAAAGIRAGADMINDVWGLKHDPELATVIADTGVACCLMHNRRTGEYNSFLEDVRDDLEETMDIAFWAGIRPDKIILDPGIGFAKNQEQNLSMLQHLELYLKWNVPLLLGTSRKSVIGNVLGLPTDQRVEGTIVTTIVGRMKGVSFFRVHDVLENRRALTMAEAILKAR